MRMERVMAAALVMAGTMGVVLLSGCQVDTKKNGNGDDVKIATPFGGLSVKTDDAGVMQAIGLPGYPGAELVKKKEKDSGSADINMSFGRFQLKVKAASFRTPDSPETVKAFYLKGLSKYGTVIQCSNNKPVGTPTQTPEGLTCDNEKDNHITVSESASGKVELKAGSKQHQHIVGIDPEGTGTKFGLVALDLPGHISFGDGKQDDEDKQ